jgi:hypothetical protein
MAEVLQKGNPGKKTPQTLKDTVDFYTSGGKTGEAKEVIRTRKDKLEAEETKAVGGNEYTPLKPDTHSEDSKTDTNPAGISFFGTGRRRVGDPKGRDAGDL